MVRARVLRIVGACVVPIEKQSASFRLGQKRQLRDALRRVGDYAFEQSPQVSGYPADRVLVEEVCVVLERALKFGA